MSWKAVTEGASNALRFATEQEAIEYGSDLWSLWMGCPSHPEPAESDDPVSHVWEDGKLRGIDQLPESGRVPPRRVQL